MSPEVSTAAPAIEFGPDPSRWAELIASPDRDARSHDIRRELGLPTDRAIVMSGHQGAFWHAGIAAKLMAGRALADRTGSAFVWIVVDTDPGDSMQIEVPVRDAGGALEVRSVDASAQHPFEGVEPGFASLPGRLAAVRASLERHAKFASSPALRATLATMDALPGEKPILLRSTQLAATRSFASFVDRIASAADRVLPLYNSAVAKHPDAGVQPLQGGRHAELPFWSVGPDGARRAALIGDEPFTIRWPRALTLTGFLRAFACDLFIHGTGGRAYEPINDDWLPQADDATLAPFVTATATLRLRFDGDASLTRADAAKAAWLAHHASHHPERVGDAAAQRERDALVAQIAAQPYGSAHRASLYHDLCTLLEQHRSRHAAELRTLNDTAQQTARIASEAEIRERRTFATVLHDPSDLDTLRRSTEAAFGGVSA